MTTMQRHLDRLESTFQKINMGLVPLGVEYRGDLNVENLDLAFRKLCIKYPILRAQITQNDDQYLLRVSDIFYPEMTISDGDASTIFRECISAENQADGRVMQPILIRSRGDYKDHGYVAMGVDHSIIDAASVTQYLGDLWQLYSDLQNGKSIAPEAETSLPRSPHEILTEYWPAYAAQFDERVNNDTDNRTDNSTKSESTANDNALPTGVVQTVYFSSEETKAILRTCKSNEISVGSFLGAVLAATLRSYNDDRDAVPIRFNIRVDARNRLESKLSSTETTFIVVDIPAKIDVKPRDNPLRTAARLNKKIKSITENFSMQRGFKPGEMVGVDIALNNAGNIPSFSSPNGIEILEFVSPLIRIRESIERSEDRSLLYELDRRCLCLKQTVKCAMGSLSYDRKLRVMFKMREDVPLSTIANFENRITEITTADLRSRAWSTAAPTQGFR